MIDFSKKNRKNPTPDGILKIPDPRRKMGLKFPKFQNSIEVAGSRSDPRPKVDQATSMENDLKDHFWPKSDRGSLVTFASDHPAVSRFGQKRDFSKNHEIATKRDTVDASTKKADWQRPNGSQKGSKKFAKQRSKSEILTPLPRHLFWNQKRAKKHQKVPNFPAYKFFRWPAP